ncbi:YraN family protein [soil metagenome]
MNNNRTVGSIGEDLATIYLQDNDFIILKRNATSRWGELDIVAVKDNKIYFFEVKTRISTRQGNPYEAVQGLKVRNLSRTIQYFVLANKLQDKKLQLDVISIELYSDYTLKKLKRYEDLGIRISS